MVETTEEETSKEEISEKEVIISESKKEAFLGIDVGRKATYLCIS